MPFPFNTAVSPKARESVADKDGPEYLKLTRWTTYSMLGLLGIELIRFMRDFKKKRS